MFGCVHGVTLVQPHDGRSVLRPGLAPMPKIVTASGTPSSDLDGHDGVVVDMCSYTAQHKLLGVRSRDQPHPIRTLSACRATRRATIIRCRTWQTTGTGRTAVVELEVTVSGCTVSDSTSSKGGTNLPAAGVIGCTGRSRGSSKSTEARLRA